MTGLSVMMRLIRKIGFAVLILGSFFSTAAGQSSGDQSSHAAAEHEQLEAGKITEHSIFHLESRWINYESKPRTLSQALSGKPTVGAMIYTSCEHACSLIVNDMMKIERELGENAADVRFTLFSMDPKQDTPKKLALYRQDKELGQWDLYTPRLAGSELELAIALGIRIKPLASGHFAHSNVIFVLNAEGEAVHQQNGLGLPPDKTVAAVKSVLPIKP